MRQITFLLILLLGYSSVQAADSSREAAARRFLEASRSAAIIDLIYDSMEPQFLQMSEQLGIAADQRDIFDRHMKRVMDVLREEMNWEKLEPYMIAVHVDVYTEDELNQLADFYESPLGQKTLDKAPQLMEKTMMLTQTLMAGFNDRIQELQVELLQDLEAQQESGH